ncbi:TIGR03086 family metal-binding protein [Streptomyces aidingensis]|uniref:TIGR03086 family protein n=1 Tax=Streptomyces aidingensis TaxID=910347 RepID=A0A1I1VBK5_9ACTN|nr:TIGR03086 family metal-binding protein [Streptomyces aidingensis]SFD79348.1 TIGR03086 family protein [Streptomyces aidingensis]
MDTLAVVGKYYDAWINHAGDMSGVPLDDGLVFTGPVASFDSADGFRAMARQAGAAVRGFRVRRQFSDGDTVCSVIDWEMDPLPGTLTAAEVLQVRDGRIIRGELVYDAEELRGAMAAAAGDGERVVLLRRSAEVVATALEQVPAGAWTAPSGCAAWTVRQAAGHLAGGLLAFARLAEGERVDAAEFDPQHQAGTDVLGDRPAAAFREIAERCAGALAAPGTAEREFTGFPGGPVRGAMIAGMCLVETVVHGWDVAHAAGVPYPADEEAVRAVWEFTRDGVGEEQRKLGRFGAQILVSPTAPPFTTLLAHLGRQA